jgi:hypothetical protein
MSGDTSSEIANERRLSRPRRDLSTLGVVAQQVRREGDALLRQHKATSPTLPKPKSSYMKNLLKNKNKQVMKEKDLAKKKVLHTSN